MILDPKSTTQIAMNKLQNRWVATPEEREPQLFENQVRHHINEDNMELPTTTAAVQSVSYYSNIQTAIFFKTQQQFHDMTQ